ncbi:TPA: YbhB/YbcL family Raf kinase inhibitor-like protein [Legionella feeleii]|uniref:Phosphatidylethanolamine-binding protein n=1 Tax=Legionella feeleii TaxID=453 RepID=A0A0W0TV21_9GAMM|nr:YbhB/YbcL family Raf kinase inhibitor-like protein [Legionella feeleii]KTC99256.1 Phosphatidylethanolamine-binding protein [Legionella feeleii]SPX62681.1 Phosphatidylethanolamine-binding protein [Legionella feeleii]STX39084.1 Phosphatidylethanolamine-binding protein [Legionella feeleii]
MSLSLMSPAFAANTLIPAQYTCQGADISPALLWQDAPAETKSYVLILDDPDAPGGDWVHWVVFNIPPTVQRLADDAELPTGAVNSKNSWGQTGYRGPCPPSGTHRYFFKLYALDTLLTLNANATKQDLLTAMANHVLEKSELIGLYRKQ